MYECEKCKEMFMEDEMVFMDCNGRPVGLDDVDDIAARICGACYDEEDAS